MLSKKCDCLFLEILVAHIYATAQFLTKQDGCVMAMNVGEAPGVINVDRSTQIAKEHTKEKSYVWYGYEYLRGI